MKFSIDPEVRRISASGHTVANPRIPTVKPSAEEIAGLMELLTRIEKAIGKEVASWVEIAQLRFQQSEEQTEWVASFRMVLKEPGSEKKIISEGYILRDWLSSDQKLRMAISVVADRVKSRLRLRRDELSKIVHEFDAALASIVVPKRN